MTDFTKAKISFALALLGTLFALHPFVEKYADVGFDYEGYNLKIFYAFALTAGLLAFSCASKARLLAILGDAAPFALARASRRSAPSRSPASMRDTA